MFHLTIILLNAQELKPIYPESAHPPQISISFDKSLDLSKCCLRLAIVGIDATFDPRTNIDDENSTIEIVYSGYERNLIAFGFTLIERNEMNKVLDELALSMSGLINESTSIQIGQILSAQVVCLIKINAITRVPGYENFMTSFKIIQVETGEVVASGVNSNTINGTAETFTKFANDYSENWAVKNMQKGFELYQVSKLDSAILYLQAALSYFESKNDQESQLIVGVLFNNIGAAYKKKEQSSKAYEWLIKSIQYNKDIDSDMLILANSNQHLSEVYLQNNDYENAEKYAQKGLKISKKNKNIEMECKNLKLLLEIFTITSNLKDYEKAMERYREIICN